jgi:ABC-type amino acid transport substrate-binding protein
MREGETMRVARSDGPCAWSGAIARLLVGLLVSAVLLLSTAEHASAQTLVRVRDTGVLRVGYRQDAQPFSYQDAAAGAKGYSVALCQKIADAVKEKLQLPELRTEFVPVASEEDGVDALRQGKIDLHCGATTATLGRRENVAFSIPIFPSGVGALLRKDAPARIREILAGRPEPDQPRWRASLALIFQKRIFAVRADSTAETWLRQGLKKFNIVADIVPVADYEAGVNSVGERRADVLFGDRTVLLGAAARSSFADDLMVVDRRFTYEALALALARGDEDLRLLVDRTLSRLYSSGEIAEIYKSSFGELDEAALSFFRMNALPE